MCSNLAVKYLFFWVGVGGIAFVLRFAGSLMFARPYPCKMLNFYGFVTLHNNVTKFTFVDNNSICTVEEYSLLFNFS
jgi:hypothetical protein